MIISGDPLLPSLDDAADLDEAAERRDFEITKALHDQRLDLALTSLVPEFSRSYLQQLIAAGFVTVDGKTAKKPSARVKLGSRGCVELRPTPQSQAFRPEPMDLPIIFEDGHLLVIDKPAGLVVHPAPGHWSGTLLNGLLAHHASAIALPRAGIVHRLDKNTSGLMVIARSRPVMDALVRMIAGRDVSRQYLAVTDRPWPGPRLRDIDAPIGRDPRNRLRMAVVDTHQHPGKLARTTVELLQSSASGSLVKCTLHTGRTHQIRVHLASIGCPLVDDDLYGGTALHRGGRQALHATRLAFTHPATQQALSFQAPLPTDLAGMLAQLGLRYNEV